MVSIKASIIIMAHLAVYVRAHGALVAVSGANGVQAAGFGIVESTPRDGSSPNPFEQDTSIIRDREISSGKAGVCGRTKIGGNNDVETQIANASSAGLPTASADGTVTMTLHQVNQDGAGPYTCEVSTDGTGSDFAKMTMVTNVPGVLSLSGATATDFPLVAQMPSGTNCTGGPDGNACLVRCKNKAIAGPFGGCAAVTTDGPTTGGASPAAAADDAKAGGGLLGGLAGGLLGGGKAGKAAKAAKGGKAGKAAKAAKGGKAGGGLKKLLGARDTMPDEEILRRILNSRVVGRQNAGIWV